MSRLLILLALLTALLSGCGQEAPPTAPAVPTPIVERDAPIPTPELPQEVRLVTHDSFSISDEVLTAFEEAHNANVVLIPISDAGAMVNQAILSRNNPLGDVMYGVDTTFLTRALNAELFVPYESPRLDAIADRIAVDPTHRVTPIDFGDVCLNYDLAWFEEAGLAPPRALEDLTDPRYRELTVVMNPATSSPGLAFLLTTVGHFGETEWPDYWAELRENGVLVASGWSEAYFTHFTGGSPEGSRPIVVSYASSPAASGGQTASLLADGSCFRQVEYAGLLQNAANPTLGQQLIDFMLSEEFQADLPLQMYVYPVVEGIPLPDEFEAHATVADAPAEIADEFIEANRDELIERWSDIVLQ